MDGGDVSSDGVGGDEVRDGEAPRDGELRPAAAGSREGSGRAAVVLALPWDKDLVVIARSAAAHVGVRAGFSRQEVEDLRLAVDEACALVLALPEPDGEPVLDCRFRVADGLVAFEVTATVDGVGAPEAGEFGWYLLGALVDSIDWVSEAGVSGVRAEKRGGPR